MFESLGEKLNNAFKKFRNKGKLTEADVKAGMREIKLALLEADVNFKVVREFIKIVSERAVGSEVLESLLPAQQIVKIVHEELINLMGGSQSKLQISSKPPTVVMMVGLQGAGKTTHAGKLAGLYRKQGKKPYRYPVPLAVVRYKLGKPHSVKKIEKRCHKSSERHRDRKIHKREKKNILPSAFVLTESDKAHNEAHSHIKHKSKKRA